MRSRIRWVGVLLMATSGFVVAGCGTAFAPSATGDPGGRIMATLMPLVKAVPGFASDKVLSFSFPGGPTTLPSTYVERVEPGRILCGHPKAWIWMPVSVEVVFNRKESGQQLVKVLDGRLERVGWTFIGHNAPRWSDPGGFNLDVWGNSPTNPSKVFILSLGSDGRMMQGWFEAPSVAGPNDNILSCTAPRQVG